MIYDLKSPHNGRPYDINKVFIINHLYWVLLLTQNQINKKYKFSKTIIEKYLFLSKKDWIDFCKNNESKYFELLNNTSF